MSDDTSSRLAELDRRVARIEAALSGVAVVINESLRPRRPKYVDTGVPIVDPLET